MQILARSFTFLGLHLSTALFSSVHRFSIGLRSSDWELWFFFSFLSAFWGMLWVLVLLESPPTTLWQRQTDCQPKLCDTWWNPLYHWYNSQCPWTTGRKTDPIHHWPSPWVWGTSPCMHLCFDGKHTNAESDQNITFSSHLTTLPLFSLNLSDQMRPKSVKSIFCNGHLRRLIENLWAEVFSAHCQSRVPITLEPTVLSLKLNLNANVYSVF